MKAFGVILIVCGLLSVVGGLMGSNAASRPGSTQAGPFFIGLGSALGLWSFAALLFGVAQVRDTARRILAIVQQGATPLSLDEADRARDLNTRFGEVLGARMGVVLGQAAERGVAMTDAEAMEAARRMQRPPAA